MANNVHDKARDETRDEAFGTGWTVLIVDDEESLRHLLRVILERAGFVVYAASDGQHAIELLDDHPEVRIVLSDIRMPRMDGMGLLDRLQGRDIRVVMMSAYGSTDTALEAVGRGALDYISKPFRADEIRLCMERIVERERLESENARLREQIGVEPDLCGFVGRSEKARQVQEMVRKVAAFPSTVLLTGESGTGKELLARALHACSLRSTQPFVAVNCAAIPESLLESEVFGHERGAFTGAVRAHQGLFEQADGGTLFLDEIGDMPLGLQTRLLRVLEDGRVRRVGGSGDKSVDVRLVAATGQDLDVAVQAKTFRQDLLYRLKVVHIRVPPLRERRADIPLLCDTLLLRIATRLGRPAPTLAPAALRLLEAHPWMGNVRELENTLERASLMREGTIIEVAHLPDDWGGRDVHLPSGASSELSIKKRTAALERSLIQQALQQTKGNRSQAARLLDISYKALVYKIRGYGLGD